MQRKQQFLALVFRNISRRALAALAITIVFVPTVVLPNSVQVRTFNVIPKPSR
jgi:hypothetical protein